MGTRHSVAMRLMESTVNREMSSFRSLSMSNCLKQNRGTKMRHKEVLVHVIYYVIRYERCAEEKRREEKRKTENRKHAVTRWLTLKTQV